MITRGETAIAQYLITGQSDYGDIRKEAFTDLQLDLINREMKKDIHPKYDLKTN
jgi:hypothetical protein